MKIVVPSAPIEEENYQSFASDFEEEYGRQPTSWAAYAYDCAINAALAIQAADEFTGAALQETVRRVSGPKGRKRPPSRPPARSSQTAAVPTTSITKGSAVPSTSTRTGTRSVSFRSWRSKTTRTKVSTSSKADIDR